MEKINIQINNPCSENFKSFQKTDNGGFCNSCKKNVVDFTKMSDQEIFRYFENQESKTCGLFLESQLKNYSNPSHSKNRKMSTTFTSSLFGISLVSLLSLTNAYSQQQTNATPMVKEENSGIKKENDSVDFKEKITVTGIVSDALGPLPGATIYWKSKNSNTSTDVDGKFTFPIQLEIGDVLTVSLLGYNDKEIIVKSKNESITMSYDVKLDNCQFVMVGEVATNKVYKSKRTIFQKIKSLFTND